MQVLHFDGAGFVDNAVDAASRPFARRLAVAASMTAQLLSPRQLLAQSPLKRCRHAAFTFCALGAPLMIADFRFRRAFRMTGALSAHIEAAPCRRAAREKLGLIDFDTLSR